MGQWMSEEQFGKELDARFPGCMAGQKFKFAWSYAEDSNVRPPDVRRALLDGTDRRTAVEDRH